MDARSSVMDCVRGLAAVCVALFHFNEIHPAAPDLYHRLAKVGWIGVPAFFVVSGYCITQARMRDALAPFWARRLLRIYPPFWGSLALVAAIAGARWILIGVNDVTVLPHDVPAVLYTLAGLAEPASAVHPINWVYWSLSYEIAFYIVLGSVMVHRQSVGLIAFGLVALWLRRFGYPFDQWGLFSLGISACYLARRQFWAGSVLFALATVHIATTRSAVEIGAAVATFVLIAIPPRLFAHAACAPVRWTGRVSYSLYLIHVPIGCHIAARLIDPWFKPTISLLIARDVLLLTMCLLAAHVFHMWIEAPSHRLARNVFRPGGLTRNPRETLGTAGTSRVAASTLS